MKKIVVLNNIPEFKDDIQKAAPEYEVIFTKTKEEASKELVDAEIVFGWSKDVERICLDKDKTNLKWVQNFYAGVDGLPQNKLKEKGVILTSGSGVHPRQLSESVFATMLALARRIPECVEAQKTKTWQQKELAKLDFDEIHGKTIGILGTGEIGTEIAKIARAFSMPVFGMRRTNKPSPYLDEVYTTDQLYILLQKCEYIVNVLPLTDETKGIIDEKAFDSMKQGVRYFAFGRGETTVTEDLINAIKSGKVGAAGIDVVNPEPLPNDSDLWDLPNVIVMPHISGTTPYYNRRIVNIFVKNLKDYTKGKTPKQSLVDYNKTY